MLTLIAEVPAATQVAPINPPNRAWEDDDGSPTSQVTRFHRMAPTNPAKITVVVIFASSTRPLEMVNATCTDSNAPTRFSTPDSRTATLGDSAPVAIEVATAFAVSWNPLVKSNSKAVTTTSTTSASTVLLHDVSTVLADARPGPAPSRRAAPRPSLSGSQRQRPPKVAPDLIRSGRRPRCPATHALRGIGPRPAGSR